MMQAVHSDEHADTGATGEMFPPFADADADWPPKKPFAHRHTWPVPPLPHVVETTDAYHAGHSAGWYEGRRKLLEGLSSLFWRARLQGFVLAAIPAVALAAWWLS